MISAKEVWILAEQKHGDFRTVTFEILGIACNLAKKLEGIVGAVVLGHDIKEQSKELIFYGADKVYVIEHAVLTNFDSNIYANCLYSLVQSYRPFIFIAPATSTGRTIMPILAAKLRTGLTADCTELDIEEETGLLLQTRPAIGGNVMATIKTPRHRPQMATVRPHAYPPAQYNQNRDGEVIQVQLSEEVFTSRLQLLQVKPMSFEKNLDEAKIVVCAGRGIGRAENIRWVKELADLLDGAVGASRPVVDQGWLPYPHQIGLSGKTVSPELYIACGVSGAIQHLAGMRNSKIVIAINKDPYAPIFKAADLAVVGDINEILPRLVQKIREAKGQNAVQ